MSHFSFEIGLSIAQSFDQSFRATHPTPLGRKALQCQVQFERPLYVCAGKLLGDILPSRNNSVDGRYRCVVFFTSVLYSAMIFRPRGLATTAKPVYDGTGSNQYLEAVTSSFY